MMKKHTPAEQLKYANELLRAALDILEEAQEGPYVKEVGHCTTRANGGGDGMCVTEEISDYFETYGVTRTPDFPQIDED